MPLNSSKQFAFLKVCLLSLSYASESAAVTTLEGPEAVQSSEYQLNNAVFTQRRNGNKLRKSSNDNPKSWMIDNVKFHCSYGVE